MDARVSKLEPGMVFGGRYELVRELGRGGNSRVFHALDKESDDGAAAVALKICVQDKSDKGFIPRFLREAFQLSRLDHTNIMKLLDFGNHGGVYYLATEFIDGASLGEYLKSGPVSEETAIVIAREMGKAFAHMDEFGVIHRDIKSDNILVSKDGQVVLVDFGLAKEAGQKTVSTSDDLYCTPQFLSPEFIADSKDISIKADIYSLGVTLFFIVSGKLPFNAKSPVEIIRQQLQDIPPRLDGLVPGISSEFADAVARMLEKDPAARCSLAEMIEMFDELAKRYA